MMEKTGIKSSDQPSQGFALPVANLIVSPVLMQPVTTVESPPLPIGSPIMPEGFITGTQIRT